MRCVGELSEGVSRRVRVSERAQTVAVILHTRTDLQHHNDISIHDGAEAVRNNDGGPLLTQRCHGFLNAPLCQAVQGGGGLIQQQNERVAQQGPSKSHPLLLAPTEAQPPFPNHRLVVLREALCDGFVYGCGFSGLVDIIVVC